MTQHHGPISSDCSTLSIPVLPPFCGFGFPSWFGFGFVSLATSSAHGYLVAHTVCGYDREICCTPGTCAPAAHGYHAAAWRLPSDEGPMPAILDLPPERPRPGSLCTPLHPMAAVPTLGWLHHALVPGWLLHIPTSTPAAFRALSPHLPGWVLLCASCVPL